jgi:hypothetical protein
MTPEERFKKLEEADERIRERHEALAQSVELLRGSVSDLTAVAHQLVADRKEERERDRQYLKALASLLEHWAGRNGD